MTLRAPEGPIAPGAHPDAESRRWLEGLRAHGAARERWVGALHALLLRAARRELHRRRGWLPDLTGPEFDDVAHQSADDALVAVLATLDTYRGASRFTTWAYRFVINNVSLKTRRHVWNRPAVLFDEADWERLPDRLLASPDRRSEQRAQLDALRAAVDNQLTRRQREVFVSVGLNEVPIDVVALRLGSTRGAVYKVLFDARAKLRASLAEAGYPVTAP